MHKKILATVSLLISSACFAESPLPAETASTEVMLLSECAGALASVSQPGSWIGTIDKVGKTYQQEDFSYIYNVFKLSGWSTEKIGSVVVQKEYIPNPPADGSAYKTHCLIQR